MADWDADDLVVRCKRESGVPTTTEFPANSDWFAWLTDAQHRWFKVFATHVPESQFGDPVKLVTADGGYTYDFTSVPWGGVEIRESRNGAVLIPGAEYDPGADYVRELKKIRFPGGIARTFADGPYARYIATPAAINTGGSAEPTLLPAEARIILVYEACASFASRGGRRDPRPYERRALIAAWGDPAIPGDEGVIPALKKQYLYSGAEAYMHSDAADWWRWIDNGSGYPTIN